MSRTRGRPGALGHPASRGQPKWDLRDPEGKICPSGLESLRRSWAQDRNNQCFPTVGTRTHPYGFWVRGHQGRPRCGYKTLEPGGGSTLALQPT